MKSSVIERPADTVLDLQCMPGHVLLEEHYFATIPLIAIQSSSAHHQADKEEECYTLFEEAISARAERVSRQLSRISLTDDRLAAKKTRAITARRSASFRQINTFWLIQQCAIRRTCLGLGLLLLGFDLMGLLVLLR
jgi:hypothetical protein